VTRIVIDTNVLVSFLTDRNAEQQARAAELFEAAMKGEVEIILHQIVISEMVYVLANLYKLPTLEIAQVVDDLLSTAGVTPVDEVVWGRVLELWPERFGDFADAVLAAVASGKRYDAVATFDRKFLRRLRKGGVGTLWKA
jgi:predicted nucleic acid-binding protein